jgi:D-sedoheptulose 7-phosphate isomerase
MMSIGRAPQSRVGAQSTREMIGDPAHYSARLCCALTSLDLQAVTTLAHRIRDAVRGGNRIFLAGNGGSASTASHYACDLILTLQGQGLRPSIRNLAESPSVVTALANDHGYEDVFRRLLMLEGGPGDLLIAISASGESENVLRAARTARELGISVASITGFGGGRLRELADLVVNVEDRNYGIIEDVHLSIGHMLSQAMMAGSQGQNAARDSFAR